MAAQHTKHNCKSRSSCPEGWMPAGYSVPLRLTVRQEHYCRRAIGITRFIYNLCMAGRIASAAPIACRGLPGRTYTKPSTPASARTTRSSQRLRAVSKRARSWTSVPRFGTGATLAIQQGRPVSGRGAGRVQGHSAQLRCGAAQV